MTSRPDSVSRAEWCWVWTFAAGVMAVTCLPYLFVLGVTPPDGVFLGLLANSDDQGVYLAWMRQAQDGRFFFRNLFTTEPQLGRSVHLYFWLLGTITRFVPISLPLMLHLGRVVCGVATLLLLYRLIAIFTDDVRVRKLALWVTTFATGFGWIEMLRRVGVSDLGEFWGNVRLSDLWHTEMFTFPSLYVNGLFPISFVLMLAVLLGLLLAERRRDLRYAAGAGVAGLLMGNIHS